MGIADNYKGTDTVSENGGGKRFLGSKDFDNGMTLIAKGMEVFTPNDQKYGVKNQYGAGGVVVKEHYLVKTGVLKEGESFKYLFETEDGQEVQFDNNSLAFYFAFTRANPASGEKVAIKREQGETQFEVDWVINKA